MLWLFRKIERLVMLSLLAVGDWRAYVALTGKHPFDSEHGTDTSGVVSVRDLRVAAPLKPQINEYAATQPSIVRQLIATIADSADLRDYAFIDIGCGKGRATLVASEYPFRQITGIEIDPVLAQTARKNAALFAQKYPNRPRITIHRGEATSLPPLSGKCVFFLYNPFGDVLMKAFAEHLSGHLDNTVDHAFVLYHNPVESHALDAQSSLRRWFVGHFSHDASEEGTGYLSEAISAIWQSHKNNIPSPHEGSAHANIAALITPKGGGGLTL